MNFCTHWCPILTAFVSNICRILGVISSTILAALMPTSAEDLDSSEIFLFILLLNHVHFCGAFEGVAVDLNT